jgi:hypothetical protein
LFIFYGSLGKPVEHRGGRIGRGEIVRRSHHYLAINMGRLKANVGVVKRLNGIDIAAFTYQQKITVDFP